MLSSDPYSIILISKISLIKEVIFFMYYRHHLTLKNYLMFQAKKAGSKLKCRIVAEKSIAEWSQLIEQMEDQILAVLQEERFLYIVTSCQ